MNNKALAMIDLQNDITKNYKEIIETTNQAIDWAAGAVKKVPQQCSQCLPALATKNT